MLLTKLIIILENINIVQAISDFLHSFINVFLQLAYLKQDPNKVSMFHLVGVFTSFLTNSDTPLFSTALTGYRHQIGCPVRGPCSMVSFPFGVT